MPAKSKKQQKAAGMALAAKRGEISPNKLKGSAKQMYKSMTQKQLKEYAETKRKGLPTRVKKKKKGDKKKKRKKRRSKKNLGSTYRFGKPRTDAERRKRHKARFGTSKLPPRGTGRMRGLIRQKVKEL